jgi:hypothetical protein
VNQIRAREDGTSNKFFSYFGGVLFGGYFFGRCLGM